MINLIGVKDSLEVELIKPIELQYLTIEEQDLIVDMRNELNPVMIL